MRLTNGHLISFLSQVNNFQTNYHLQLTGAHRGMETTPLRKGIIQPISLMQSHPNLGVFIENYGNLQQSDFDSFLDGGIAYLINNNLQLDLYSGFGKNDEVKDFFVSAGISWRTK
jgi:hypothetical protein